MGLCWNSKKRQPQVGPGLRSRRAPTSRRPRSTTSPPPPEPGGAAEEERPEHDQRGNRRREDVQRLGDQRAGDGPPLPREEHRCAIRRSRRTALQGKVGIAAHRGERNVCRRASPRTPWVRRRWLSAWRATSAPPGTSRRPRTAASTSTSPSRSSPEAADPVASPLRRRAAPSHAAPSSRHLAPARGARRDDRAGERRVAGHPWLHGRHDPRLLAERRCGPDLDDAAPRPDARPPSTRAPGRRRERHRHGRRRGNASG